MEKQITYETLRRFAYSNDHLIQGKIRGIVLRFCGLNTTKMENTDPAEAYEYAERNLLYVIPYYDPWCWMNDQAVRYITEVLDVLYEHYGLDERIGIVSTGDSMGGLGALTYCVYAKIQPIACVTNCPACDLVYHLNEREDLPHTIYNAFFNFDGTMEEALQSRSPWHLIPQMPRIPYTIFYCELDKLVNNERHSIRFTQEMRKIGHEITLIHVPHRPHCNLSPEAKIAYRNAILAAFESQ